MEAMPTNCPPPLLPSSTPTFLPREAGVRMPLTEEEEEEGEGTGEGEEEGEESEVDVGVGIVVGLEFPDEEEEEETFCILPCPPLTPLTLRLSPVVEEVEERVP